MIDIPTRWQDLTLAQLEDDPYPTLETMRREDPVCWVPALEMFFVTRWDDVATIEADPGLFTAATEPSFLARTLGVNMLTVDPPELDHLRSMMLPAFKSAGRSGPFVRDELVPMADTLLDQVEVTMAADGAQGFDVISQYAQLLSAGALATVLGLDEHGFDQMWSWCVGLVTDLANFENDPELAAVGDKAKAELGLALADVIERATDRDGGTAIDTFIANGATPEEIVNNVRLMISGGINEPCEAIGLVTWVLLTQPDLAERIAAEPDKMNRLIEEVLRVHSPVGTITRQATSDTELAGVAIPKGALVSGILRSINRDETHWTNPTEIDLDRRQGAHAAFALGAHRCLGEWMGRQTVKQGVLRLFDRFPDLGLDPDHTVLNQGFEFRGPPELWVTI